jgi:uncharacterized membrane protein YfcA
MDPTITDTVLIAAITFFAALAQGATGFGFAIIALPLLLLVMGSLDAVGLTIILSLLVSLVLVPGLWRQAPRGPVARLAVGSALGFPIGLVIFLQANLDWVRLAVGVVILFLAAWLALSCRRAATIQTRAAAQWPEVAVGILSGAMTTALAMPGPSVMLYLSARGMAKVPLRACTLCLFALSYGAALALQVAFGAIGGQIGWTAASAALPTLLGAFLGQRLSVRLDEGLFRSLVLTILLATGAYTTLLAILPWF